MDKLIPVEQKLVNFNGAEIMAIKTSDNKVNVGVRWVCNGIGLTEGQTNGQMVKVQNDAVLSKGVRKIVAPTTSGNQELNCIELDFLPLWLAKINANIIEDQEVQERLIEYQIRAKDVLAAAFITKSVNSQRQKESSWDAEARAELRFAREFAKVAGIRKDRVITVALNRIANKTGQAMEEYRRTLPPVEEENAETLNAGQLGERFDLKASAINLLLEEMGLQYGIREAGKKPGTERLVKRNPWKLTEEGRKCGVMQDASDHQGNKKWEGFQILWSVKTVDMIREYLAQKADKGQMRNEQ